MPCCRSNSRIREFVFIDEGLNDIRTRRCSAPVVDTVIHKEKFIQELVYCIVDATQLYKIEKANTNRKKISFCHDTSIFIPPSINNNTTEVIKYERESENISRMVEEGEVYSGSTPGDPISSSADSLIRIIEQS